MIWWVKQPFSKKCQGHLRCCWKQLYAWGLAGLLALHLRMLARLRPKKSTFTCAQQVRQIVGLRVATQLFALNWYPKGLLFYNLLNLVSRQWVRVFEIMGTLVYLVCIVIFANNSNKGFANNICHDHTGRDWVCRIQ